jgi:hypothetical protein
VKGIHGREEPTPAASLAPIAVYQIAAAGGTGVGEPVPGLSLECPPQAPQSASRARRVTNW